MPEEDKIWIYRFIKFTILTIILWPFALPLFVFQLRKSLTKYPKRLDLHGLSMIQSAIENWLRSIDRHIPFGSHFWFVDKPQPPGEYDEEFWKRYKQEQEEFNKMLKDEYGIE